MRRPVYTYDCFSYILTFNFLFMHFPQNGSSSHTKLPPDFFHAVTEAAGSHLNESKL